MKLYSNKLGYLDEWTDSQKKKKKEKKLKFTKGEKGNLNRHTTCEETGLVIKTLFTESPGPNVFTGQFY